MSSLPIGTVIVMVLLLICICISLVNSSSNDLNNEVDLGFGSFSSDVSGCNLTTEPPVIEEMNLLSNKNDPNAFPLSFGSFSVQNDNTKFSGGMKGEVETVSRISISNISISMSSDESMNADEKRMNSILEAERVLKGRLESETDFILTKRAESDFNYNFGGFCGNTLFSCIYFTELQAENDEDSNKLKKTYLDAIFKVFHHTNSENDHRDRFITLTLNSLHHSICFDGFKSIGKFLSLDHIAHIVSYAPEILFDNAELLSSLSDYSFITLAMFKKNVSTRFAAKIINFLELESFWKTAQREVLLFCLWNSYNPCYHEEHLALRTGLGDRLFSADSQASSLLADPQNYSFISELMSKRTTNCNREISDLFPGDFVVNFENINNSIRDTNVLSFDKISAILSFILETNRLIISFMNEIAYIWADLHKNIHVIGNTDEEFDFDEAIKVPFDNLMFIRAQRNLLSTLIEDLSEDKEIQVDEKVKSCPNWLKSLKTLAFTPFDAFTRLTYELRFMGTSDFHNHIHQNDLKKLVVLPRVSVTSNQELIAFPDFRVLNSIHLRAALWRNIFHEYEYRELDIEDRGDNNLLNSQFNDLIYRENETTPVKAIDILTAYLSFIPVLPQTHRNGYKYIQFLLDISHPPPPADICHPHVYEERKVMISKMILAVLRIDPHSLSEEACALLKSTWYDSEEIIQILISKSVERIDINAANHDDPYPIMPFNVKVVEYNCKVSYAVLDQCRKIIESSSESDSKNVIILQFKVFGEFRKITTAFLTLGPILSDSQIASIESSEILMKLLRLNGRFLSRTQVASLLSSSSGRSFLRKHPEIANCLIDYSAFEVKDLVDVGISIESIKCNAATLSSSCKLGSLISKGFSSVDDPVDVAISLGHFFWSSTATFSNLSAWELLNPITIRTNLKFASNTHLLHHMTIVNLKMKSINNLNMLIIFVTKWLIAQEWNKIIFQLFSADLTKELFELYLKDVRKGEVELADWMNIYKSSALVKNEEDLKFINSISSYLNSKVSVLPLKESNNSNSNSNSNRSNQTRNKNEKPTLFTLSEIVELKFKKEKDIWWAKLEISSQLKSNNSQRISLDESKRLLQVLPLFDAVIYKRILDTNSISLDSIFCAAKRPKEEEHVILDDADLINLFEDEIGKKKECKDKGKDKDPKGNNKKKGKGSRR